MQEYDECTDFENLKIRYKNHRDHVLYTMTSIPPRLQELECLQIDSTTRWQSDSPAAHIHP